MFAGHVLYRANLTDLSLTNDAGGYLAVNITSGPGFKTFTLYIAKALDYEVRKYICNVSLSCVCVIVCVCVCLCLFVFIYVI